MTQEHPSGTLGHVSTCRFKDRSGKIHTFKAKTTGIIGAVEADAAQATAADNDQAQPDDKKPAK